MASRRSAPPRARAAAQRPCARYSPAPCRGTPASGSSGSKACPYRAPRADGDTATSSPRSPTKERELAKAIRTEITGETKTLTFLAAASTAVEAYVALWSSKHTFWTRHRASTRHSVDTIANHLRVEQIRPLMFAVALEFDPVEAEKAFRLFVSWSVRFLIYGGRGGMLDEQYSRRAQEVGTGRITKARELRDAMERYVPSDAEFEAAFATARVSRAHLAR